MYLERFIGKTGTLSASDWRWFFEVHSNLSSAQSSRHTLLEVDDHFAVFGEDYVVNARKLTAVPLKSLYITDYVRK